MHNSYTLAILGPYSRARVEPYSLARVELRVDLVDYPTEESSVECLGHGISHIHGLFHSVGSDDCLSVGHHVSAGEGRGQVVRLQTQELGN